MSNEKNDIEKQFDRIIAEATSSITDPKELETMALDVVSALKKRILQQTENWKPLNPISAKRKPSGRRNKILFNTGTLVKGIAIRFNKFFKKTKYHIIRINTSVKYGKYHTGKTGRDWLAVQPDLIKIVNDWINDLKTR